MCKLSTMAAYVNKHGRRGGRGIRPYLLMPKVIGVALLLGGTVANGVIAWSTDPAALQQLQYAAAMIRQITRWVVDPGLILAVIFGVLLLVQHPHIMLRMRWLQVKLAIVVVCLPPLMYLQVRMLHTMQHHDPVTNSLTPAMATEYFRWLVCLTAGVLVILILLGRHKPRLGQRPQSLAAQKRKKVST